MSDATRTIDAPILHASSVALAGRAALILGESGSGKSALALALMARGAALIADDRTELQHDGSQVIASCPPTIRGKIEARGVGILTTPAADPAPVSLVIDLDSVETERLPPLRHVQIHGKPLPLVYKVESSHFVDAVLLYLRTGQRS